MKISLFASAIRPNLWDEFFKSLESNTIDYEVVFAGPCTYDEVHPFVEKHNPHFRYVHTANIKPAQCYEVARRECKGELVMWVADDCEFSFGLLDIVYSYWKSLKKYNAIISVKTNEDEKNNNLDDHRFFGTNKNTPLMAPLGVLNRMYLELVGGLDRRYICGQYENDIVMRALEMGAKVHKFEEVCVHINHRKKHGTSSKFWDGYDHDRRVLESSWVIGGYRPPQNNALDLFTRVPFTPITNREVSRTQLDNFEPYENVDLLTKSQSHKGQW